jgi:hypothetical protein
VRSSLRWARMVEAGNDIHASTVAVSVLPARPPAGQIASMGMEITAAFTGKM